MLKRKQPLLRHIGAGARTEADYGQFPPQSPIFLDPSGELTKVNVAVDGACNVIYILIWIAIFFLVLGLGIGGWILADIQKQRNDVQNLQLLTLNNSVTYLDFLNMFDTYNITTLVARFYPGIPDNITALNTTLTYWEEQLLFVQNLFQIIQADLLAIFYQLQALFAFQSLIYNESLVLNETLANITTNLTEVYNLAVFYNNSFVYTINGVGATPPSKNLNISGVGGLSVYPSLTENATLVLDSCALQQQVSEIDANFTAAVQQFIEDTVMSNITVDTINGQYPIAGNIDLVAGDVYTNITTPVENEVHVAFYGIETLNGLTPNVTGGRNIDIHATGSPWMTVAQTGPKEITIGAPGIQNCLERIDGQFDVTSENTSYGVRLSNTISNAEQTNTASSRMTCIGRKSYYNSVAQNWIDGTYLDLTPNTTIRQCRYNTIPSNPIINLNEPGATYIITFKLWSTHDWKAAGTRAINGYRIELLWCLQSSIPYTMCTKASSTARLELIETYSAESPCFATLPTPFENELCMSCAPSVREPWCYVNFYVTVMYITPATTADRYLIFSAYNGAWSSQVNSLWYFGWHSEITVSRVL